MRRVATIKDIAQRAGVSVSTASRALNDNPRISQATRLKVKQVANELNYQPNYNAQNLTLGESNMVGLVFPVTTATAPANPFHIDLMRGISSALKPLQYEMVVAIAPNATELLASVKSMVTQSKVHNFLIFYTMVNDPVTAYLRKHHLNFVVIGHPTAQHPDRFVDNDNVKAGQAATERLITRHGVQRPVFLDSGANWTYEEARRDGYRLSPGRQAGTGIFASFWTVIPRSMGLFALMISCMVSSTGTSSTMTSQSPALTTVG